MDGIALSKAIQQQPGLPVIILIAHGSIPEAVSAIQEQVFSFLTKPVNRDALYRDIDEALKKVITTRSTLMLRFLDQAKVVSQPDVGILLSGQSNTGKKIWRKRSTRPDPAPAFRS